MRVTRAAGARSDLIVFVSAPAVFCTDCLTRSQSAACARNDCLSMKAIGCLGQQHRSWSVTSSAQITQHML